MALDTEFIEHELVLTVVGKASYIDGLDGRKVHEVEFSMGFGKDERNFSMKVTPSRFDAYTPNTTIKQTFYSYRNGPLSLTKHEAMAASIRPVYPTVDQGFF